jgi:hypothetical protein
MASKDDLSKRPQPEEMESAAGSAGKPTIVTEILNRAREKDREIADWLRAEEKRQDDAVREIVSQSRRALRKFRPSTVPRAARKHISYLRDRRELAPRLAEIRAKNLRPLEKPEQVKKGTIAISGEKAAELGLKKGKPVRISLTELAKIRDEKHNAGETSVEIRLAAMQRCRERDQRLVDALYQQFMSMNEESA